ncbi:MAG: ABC transporter permease [Chitinophagaceae bacterium]|nr:MAG: ABC transporter permease [Chitinophagaceae bacterium]
MDALFHLGRYFLLIKSLFVKPENFTLYTKEAFRQMDDIGIGSLGIIAIISLFIGAVTAVQFAYQLADSFVPIWWVGFVVRDSMILELAPTISCLLLAGKVGSNIASNLGSMRISEQIDALEIMGVNTTAFLIGPKILAAVIVIPLLVIISAFLGILGGLFAGIFSGYMTGDEYIMGLQDAFVPFNVFVMLMKALVFSFLLTSISCYQGFYASGGALEIGNASTRAVVISSISIIIADYLIAWLLL